MTIEKPAAWLGTSGTQYMYYVFGLAPDVPQREGNYIYAKRNDEGAWVPVYMGHGDLAVRCTDPAALRCIASKAPTHVHLRLNASAEDRATELDDLLAQYANAFAPEGCHPRRNEASAATASEPAPSSGPTAGVEAVPQKAATRKAATKKAAPAKVAAKKTATRKTAAKTAATKETTAKKTAPQRTPVKGKPKTPRRRS